MFDLTVVIEHKNVFESTIYNVKLPKIPEPGDVVQYENQAGKVYSGTVKHLKFISEWDDGRVVSRIYVYAG